MRVILRPVFAALCIASLSALTAAAPGVAFAQSAPAQQDEQKQIALSDKQIEGQIAAKPELDAIMSKVPDGAEPDAKAMAALDAAAKKHGFANFGEYSDVDANIGLVLGGFDPQTKKYVGDDVVLKQQIAEIQADKKMPAADKKEALGQLNDALKSVKPLQFQANIPLVAKYYDKLAAEQGQGQSQ